MNIRDTWPLIAGMTVAGSAAVVASAVTLAELGTTAGWVAWTPWLLPASVDVGGAVGGWVWLRPGAPVKAQQFGKWVALTCAAASLAGNAAGHLIEATFMATSPILVIIVGAVPAAVLVALAHLVALLTAHPSEPAPVTVESVPTSGPADQPPATNADPVVDAPPAATGSAPMSTVTAAGDGPAAEQAAVTVSGPSAKQTVMTVPAKPSGRPSPSGWRDGMSLAAEVEWLAAQLVAGCTAKACGEMAGWSAKTTERRSAAAKDLESATDGLSENDSHREAMA